jgi:hypothetical protein
MSGVTADEDKKPADGGVHINLKVKGQVRSLSFPYRSANLLLLFCLFAAEILVHLPVVLMWYDLGIEMARIRLALIGSIADY